MSFYLRTVGKHRHGYHRIGSDSRMKMDENQFMFQMETIDV